MKNNAETNQNQYFINQRDDIQLTSLSRISERNFSEEAGRKKMLALLENIIKKINN